MFVGIRGYGLDDGMVTARLVDQYETCCSIDDVLEDGARAAARGGGEAGRGTSNSPVGILSILRPVSPSRVVRA